MLLPLLSLVLAAPAPAPEPAIEQGRFPPPRVMVASVDPEGRACILKSTVRYVPVTKTITVIVAGRTEVRAVTESVPVMEESRFYLDDKAVTVYGVDGKKVDPKDLPKLTGDTAVIVSADGKEVAQLYRKMLKEGTLIIVAPSLVEARGGAGVKLPEDLPKPLPEK